MICAAALLGATLGAAALQAWLGIGDASAVYLLAVVVIAGRYGTWSGVIASLIAFLAYDFLFTEPRFTFNVTNPQEWLSLLLFLVVAVVIGRLAALQAERAEEANRRAREAQAMFGISRALATAEFDRQRDPGDPRAARRPDRPGPDLDRPRRRAGHRAGRGRLGRGRVGRARVGRRAGRGADAVDPRADARR